MQQKSQIRFGLRLIAWAILIGLVGTALGILLVFNRVSAGNNVAPSDISNEILIALISTRVALPIALVGLAFVIVGFLKRGT